MSSPDVLVVGGGVIGCAIARHLAARSASVVVVERDEPGAHASWAAAGMLSPLAEADRPDGFLDLLRAARTRFPALAAELRSETGIDIGYRTEGTLLLSLNRADDAVLRQRWLWQSAAGLPVELLDGAAARALEPALATGVRSALRFPDDHQVDNRMLSGALAAAARSAGARFVTGRAVARIARAGDSVTGVVLDDGRQLGAGCVVIAAGSWSGGIAGLPRPIPVEPVHGQLLAIDGTEARLGHVVDSPRVYLVPRGDGRVIAGATMERTGFRTETTVAATKSLLGAAVEAVPELEGRPILDVWSGLRPGTPDGQPILGADPEVQNLFYATGHFRNGILLAPITAEITGAVLARERPPIDITDFRIDRFDAMRPVRTPGTSPDTTR
jgi:glycine oxidase